MRAGRRGCRNPCGGGIQSVSAAEITLLSDGDSVYVGGVALTGSTESPAYATTDTSGNVITEGATAANYNIMWDGSTLTLKGAKIKGDTSSGSLSVTVGIYAFNSSGDVSLKIALEGVNEIFKSSSGIWVYSSSSDTASLTIAGGGSLNSSGSSSGIQVQSNSNNATLTIQNADVEAEVTSAIGDGVFVQAGGSANASLSVDGGSLTSTGKSDYGAGIRYTFGSSSSGSGTPSLTVSGNAMVKASGGAGGIRDNSSADIQIGDGNNSSGGIVFDNGTGTVYGDVTLQDNLTVGKDESLTLDSGASLNAGGHNVIVDGGTVDDSIKNSLSESVKYTPSITTTSLTGGTVGTVYSQTLTATGSGTITWSLAEGSSMPNGLTLNSNGTITGTPSTAGTNTFTVTAKNAYGDDSKQLTLTIGAAANVPVESVSLTPSTLALEAGKSGTLTAAITPDNATNQAVTWTSSDTAVATVENGVVTAVGAGEAIITVTTADGGKTDACTVTVTAVPEPEPEPEPEPTPEPEPEPEPEEPEEAYIPSTPIPDGFHEYSLGTMLYVDGKRVKGLYEYQGATYYFNEQGFMQTGWVELDDGWRYFDEEGKMATGWLQIGNVWYYLDPETGLMYNDGLAVIGKSTYYFYDWGGMASDWWYEAEDGWYFFGGSGAMKTAQWVQWKGFWYYLTESGKMATDTEIGGYYVNADGVWVR